MTREELTDKVLASTSNNFILELATGMGKSLISIKKIAQWHIQGNPILIVVPKNVLKINWEEEFKKWNYEYLLKDVIFVTYVSLPKYVGKTFEVIILDEAHHTSERCIAALKYINTTHMLALSATLKKEHKFFFTSKYKVEAIKVDTKEAIESEVLPDPRVVLIPIPLDNRVVNCIIQKNVKKNNIIPIKTIGYSEKWKYKNYKGPLNILCTQQQYYDDLSRLIEWYKQKGMHNAIMKNMWLHKAGERLKWLACQKEQIIIALIRQLRNYRLIAFCPSIDESNKLGCPCVNSKIGTGNLEKFNDKKIKHIATIDMLTEGANLSDCKIAIFQMINSSERVQVQKIGRALRHKSPVLIFPYFNNTREKEIVDEIIQNYNPELIKTIDINSINSIKNYM